MPPTQDLLCPSHEQVLPPQYLLHCPPFVPFLSLQLQVGGSATGAGVVGVTGAGVGATGAGVGVTGAGVGDTGAGVGDTGAGVGATGAGVR